MYLTKWDPFETLTGLQGEVDRLFNHTLSNTNNKKSLNVSNWHPVVDIHEDTEAYHFDVEVPGIDKKNLDVNIEDNVLMIKGERQYVNEDKKKNYHRIEREYGCFSRAFTLPETANVEKVNADYKDGVLKVKIAKKEAAKPKKIDVNVR